MIVQLQKQLTEADGKDPDKTFDTLKLYEMLGGLGPLDRTFLVQQADDMFATLYRGDGRIAARQSLGEHVRAMAGGSLPAIELDARLIAKVRETIRSVTPATRTFDILAGSTEARALPSWTPAAAFGALGDRAFDRTSGAPLTQGIEGLFTADGYRRVVMPGVAAAARVALSEGWVRGADDALSGETVEHVSQGALQLYFDRFEKRWADLFADIRIKPSQSLGDAVETTRALANDRNILAEAARSIAAATDLRPQTANSLAPLVASADGDSVAAVLASTVNAADPYARLRDAFAAKPGTGSTPASQKPETDTPGAMLLTKIKALHDQLARSATSSAEVAKVFDVDSQLTKSNEDLLQLSRQLPAPLDAWTAGLAADVGSIAAKAARNRASDVWSADGAALCSSIVAGRYPFVRSAERDVSLADFTRLFGPNGLFRTFFKQRLEPFVDKTATPWGWKGTFGAPGQPSAAIAQFENADKIYRTFFPNGSETPSVTMNVKPVSLSDASTAVMLELAGERVVYFHGPILAKSIKWPAKDSTSNTARLAFQPGGWQQAMTKDGDWAAFRLFDQAQIESQSGDMLRLRFTNGDQTADFDVEFGSVLNPFKLDALAKFACPTQF